MGDMSENRIPAEAFAPGEYLLDELEARGWSQADFAEILERPEAAISEIINGKRGITPATAKELAEALGTSAMFWLNLEAAYRLHITEPAPKRIRIKAALSERYPIRDMVRRGWIEYSKTPEVLESRVLDFFGVSSIEEEPKLPFAVKKTGGGEDDLTPAQLAWLYRVSQIASAMKVGSYSEKALRNALPELRALMREPEGARDVPQLLEDCGVRFVVVEPFPSSKIDGVAFWLDPSQPVIGMSLRFDRIDNFWFVLRHEIEHILRRHAGTIDSELVEHADEPGLPEQERVANSEAAEFCVPQAQLDNFIRRMKPMFSERRVVGFALMQQVHPGVVVGQLQRKIRRYNLLRKHLVKVRDIIAPVAMTDGYGQLVPL
jgi:HTH-type transcriptional regulator/antitoxin HigA